MVVGVTGKYCAGKNLVSKVLARAGFEVIDVDKLGHRALEEERGRVIKTFGDVIRDREGAVDRRLLGRIVFADKAKLRQLEEIIHPTMVREVTKVIERDPANNFVINAAILFHMGLHSLCDKVLWVEAPLTDRWRRARKRDGLSVIQTLRRMWSQRKLSPQPYRNLVDIYNVANSAGKQGLETTVLSLIQTGWE